MSLATLANDEILRTNRQTLDLARIYEPHLAPLMNNLAQITPGDLRAAVRPVAAAEPLEKTPASSALDGLVRYIPTESYHVVRRRNGHTGSHEDLPLRNSILALFRLRCAHPDPLPPDLYRKATKPKPVGSTSRGGEVAVVEIDCLNYRLCDVGVGSSAARHYRTRQNRSRLWSAPRLNDAERSGRCGRALRSCCRLTAFSPDLRIRFSFLLAAWEELCRSRLTR